MQHDTSEERDTQPTHEGIVYKCPMCDLRYVRHSWTDAFACPECHCVVEDVDLTPA